MPNPTAQVVLAFDFGDRRIGVAVGNTLTWGTQPLKIEQVQTKIQRKAMLDALLRQWDPHAIVIGLPLAEDGSEQEMSQKSRRFAEQIQSWCSLPVYLEDERFSSAEAQQFLGRKTQDDAHAAAVILQSYFYRLQAENS